MQELLKYLIESVTGIDKYEINVDDRDNDIAYNISCDPDKLGLLIGKNGNTIKSIQTLLRVKGRLENKSVFVNIKEAQI